MRRAIFPLNKSIGLLLDPDKSKGETLRNLLTVAEVCRTDYILAGGSLTFSSMDNLIDEVKRILLNSSCPFPG